MNAGTTIDILLKALGVGALVALNGFFVAAEFALVRLRGTQLDPLVAKGSLRARVARKIVDNLNAFLSVTQLGITVASLGLGWFSEPLFLMVLTPLLKSMHIASPEVQHTIAFVIGFSVITFLHIVVGELAPKWLAIQKPLTISLWIALPLRGFYVVTFPFAWVLYQTAQWLLRQLGIEPAGEGERAHSEEELRMLLGASQTKAGVSAYGRAIVLNALDLRRRSAREVMRPRKEIVALDTEASIAVCLDVAEKTRYSRFPLCEGGDLDKTMGVIHIKDLYAMRLKAKRGADLTAVARKLVFVPETARLERLLQVLLDRKMHFAIVVDEYGGTVGIVTLENILEEVVGQIQDEFDQEKPLVVKTGEGQWDVAGELPLHTLAELIGEPLQEEGVTTASGLVTRRLGGFPKQGDKLDLGAFELRVEEIDGMRVSRLKLCRRVENPPSASE